MAPPPTECAASTCDVRRSEHVQRSVAHNDHWRAWFSEVAVEAGLEPMPGVGNFVLLRFPGGQAQAEGVLADLKRRGVLVRGVAAYGLANCVRVTIGTEDEMRTTAEALKEVLR